jgi:hypothetical protein
MGCDEYGQVSSTFFKEGQRLKLTSPLSFKDIGLKVGQEIIIQVSHSGSYYGPTEYLLFADLGNFVVSSDWISEKTLREVVK